MQTQISELNEQLTEMQSVHNDSNPDTTLSVQTKRSRRNTTLSAGTAAATDTATRAATGTKAEQMAQTNSTASMDCTHAQCRTAGFKSTVH